MTYDPVFVTGGAGFIGSAVVRMLIRETDAEVVTVDKLTYAGNRDSLAPVADSPRHHFEHGDVCQAATIRSIIDRYHPSAIIHLAAESHVDRSIDGPADFIQTNVVGTFTLLEEVRRYWSSLHGARRERFRLVHVSTDEVFGSLGDRGHFDERSAYAPNSPYSASKAGADHLVRAWYHTYGVPVITTHCSNNFGPYQFPEKLIPLMILNALEGKPLPVYGGGAHVRDWLYVDDHAEALLTVLAHGHVGETYCIGGRNERRNLDVVRVICAIMNELAPAEKAPYEHLIHFVQDRPGHDLRYAIDAGKLERDLGWLPRHTFESGLRETVSWYLGNRAWWERVRSGAYRGERLGLAVASTVEPPPRAVFA